MKKIVTITTTLILGSFAQAEEAKPTSEKCPLKKCATECPDKGECDGESVSFTVTGLEKKGASEKTHEAIALIKGAEVNKACGASGTLCIKFDPTKTNVAALSKAVSESGLAISGQKASFKVSGMTCGGCSKGLTTTLAKVEGVTAVDTVCHQSGNVAVTFDPAKTDATKVKAAINATKFKVNDGKKCDSKKCDASKPAQS